MRTLLASLSLAVLIGAAPAMAQPPKATPPALRTLPADTPPVLKPVTGSYDFERREVMIPMRDGVKLHTVILVPKGAKRAPILLTRTPYNATDMTSHSASTHLAGVLQGFDNAADVIVEGGYIRVVQDIRGKYGSEGDYVLQRPLRGPLNPTEIDHATDAWDTIDWLVKSLPESNGKVAMLGASYDGMTALMALASPHPALKAVVPMNPMVNGWIGDDWFHRGAFRQINMDYVYEQAGTRAGEEKWATGHHDEYDFWLNAGSAGEVARLKGLDQIGFWNRIVAHPAYDGYWQGQALEATLGAQPISVPVLLVHSLFDEEDIYGALAMYKALEPRDVNNDGVYLAVGPWHHGGAIEDGSVLGEIRFDQDTARQFRREVLAPFLAHYLKDEAPAMDVAPVTAFTTGANVWRKLDRWPMPGAEPSKLFLHAQGRLNFVEPAGSEEAEDSYVSDPARPVTYRTGPFRPEYATDSTWTQWLVDDQRFAARRSDVLTYQTEVLTAPIEVSGEPVANIVEATTGTDGDVVVKLIDVWPDEVPGHAEMGGYQMPVSMDILRGRYRESFETARPLAPGRPLPFRFPLPAVNHVFLPGHRIMVQVQSSWFPLYDRNPQTFVANIFNARPEDYRRQAIILFHSRHEQSFVELPVVK